jgi:hypothetical protein
MEQIHENKRENLSEIWFEKNFLSISQKAQPIKSLS